MSTEQADLAVTNQICIPDVLDSILDRDIGYPKVSGTLFLQLQTIPRINSIRPRSFPSRFFPLHQLSYHSTLQSLYAESIVEAKIIVYRS
jgi:hypothetical protein